MDFSIIHYIISLIVLIINIVMFVAIKFNDLRHLEKTVGELKIDIKEYGNKVDTLGERIARMEGAFTALKKTDKRKMRR